MKLFDAHTHLQFNAFDRDREAAIERARQNGIKMICVGTQFSTSESAVRLAYQYPEDICAVAGFHPNHASEENWHHDPNEQSEAVPEKFDAKRLEKLAGDSKVVAIGECGLDYFRFGTEDAVLIGKIKEEQRKIFISQLAIANKLNKALMIHCRPSVKKNPAGKTVKTDDAYEDLLDLVVGRAAVPQISHFYVGSAEMAKKLLAAGFYFTFGGAVTFTRDYDEAIRQIPLERILLETDAPYVAPEPHRGQRNEPAYVLETAKKMAILKNVSLEELAAITTENCRRILFKNN